MRSSKGCMLPRRKGDPNLLLDIFFLPVEEGPVEPTKKPDPKKTSRGAAAATASSTAAPETVRAALFKGRICLKAWRCTITSFPASVRIEAGYAVRRGNAIRRWASDDFAFIRLPLRQDLASGVVVSRAEGNTIELRDPEARVSVRNFRLRHKARCCCSRYRAQGAE